MSPQWEKENDIIFQINDITLRVNDVDLRSNDVFAKAKKYGTNSQSEFEFLLFCTSIFNVAFCRGAVSSPIFFCESKWRKNRGKANQERKRHYE